MSQKLEKLEEKYGRPDSGSVLHLAHQKAAEEQEHVASDDRASVDDAPQILAPAHMIIQLPVYKMARRKQVHEDPKNRWTVDSVPQGRHQ